MLTGNFSVSRRDYHASPEAATLYRDLPQILVGLSQSQVGIVLLKSTNAMRGLMNPLLGPMCKFLRRPSDRYSAGPMGLKAMRR